MIHKLKKQFILINMSMVLLVLLIVFITIGWLTYNRLEMDSFIAMDKALSRKFDAPPPPLEFDEKVHDKRNPLLPGFTVTLDDKGQVLNISRENIAVSEETVQLLVDVVIQSGEETGILFNEELRYLVRTSPSGTRIAFVSLIHTFETMTSLVLSMALVGLCGLSAFFIASNYLAKWILKPVDEAWEKQKQFIADASHELRTPLTVILANTGILMAHKSDTIEQQIKWVTHTQDEANRLKTLVDDLLFLAKYDAAHKPEMLPHLSLSDTVWHTALSFEALAFEKGITLEMDIDPELELTGNPGQLKQLMVILMDNAIKYAGPDGNIHVRLKRQDNTFNLSVSNTGEVIPSEQIPHLFDRFYRGESAREREHGGYGLGLSIADTIVKTHGGTIHVESTPQKGTQFQIVFPKTHV